MKSGRPIRHLSSAVFLVLAVGLMLASPACAQEEPAQSRPLSAALREALASEPPDAVEKRFLEALKSPSFDYEFDPEGINALIIEYTRIGETEKNSVVVTVAGHAAQVAMTGMLPPELTEAAAAAEAQEARKSEEGAAAPSEEAQARQRALDRLGPPRSDLERFHGVFGEPGNPDRTVFLARNCDGHLVLGAMWGSVSPWPMRSVGDARFQYPGDDFTKPFHVDIATAAGSTATRISHDLTFIASPLERVGDLPKDWVPVCPD